MIQVCFGDIFQSRAVALVNPVNCVGIMGAGLALQFRRRFPAMHTDYVAKCRNNKLRPGQVSVYPRKEIRPGQVYSRGEMRPGQVSVYPRGEMHGRAAPHSEKRETHAARPGHEYRADPEYIVNFPTKNDWREDSKLVYIKQGLPSLRRWMEKERIPSIAIPALGCGLGGLPWANVEPLIRRELGPLQNVLIELYPPQKPHHRNARRR